VKFVHLQIAMIWTLLAGTVRGEEIHHLDLQRDVCIVKQISNLFALRAICSSPEILWISAGIVPHSEAACIIDNTSQRVLYAGVFSRTAAAADDHSFHLLGR
jgi:hypothetical protein